MERAIKKKHFVLSAVIIQMMMSSLFFNSVMYGMPQGLNNQQKQTKQETEELRAKAQKAMQNQPLVFVENKGQINDSDGKQRNDIAFSAESKGIRMFFRTDGVSYVVTKSDTKEKDKGTLYRLDMNFNSKTQPVIQGKEQTTNFTSYDVGKLHDLKAMSYQRIVYSNVYPHIDVVFYSSENNLKYDFIVHPGGNPADIQLEYKGG